jgi:lipid II:glycine glycyltransferase (peptidoglycan interpeptide bridge formation enzyme)
MIIDAKEDGKKYFDFWGIAPEGAENHPWAGLTAYKKSFGGEVVSSLGTYDIVINKTKYRLYNTYKKLRGRK